MPAACWRRRTTGACCWRIPTVWSGASIPPATSATGSTSTSHGRWSSGADDRVRWTRNDASRGLINGEHAELLSIGPVNVRMRTQDGREIAMRRDDPQLHHLDHAYSSTVHAAQGLTCDRVIAVLATDRGAPADQAMFYLELTRARDNVVLLTDDREALIEALETAPAEELSALRAIGEQFKSPDPTVAQRPPPAPETIVMPSWLPCSATLRRPPSLAEKPAMH